jgi:hypothetical protein
LSGLSPQKSLVPRDALKRSIIEIGEPEKATSDRLGGRHPVKMPSIRFVRRDILVDRTLAIAI